MGDRADRIESLLASVGDAYRSVLIYEQDRAAADELMLELRPTLDALLEARATSSRDQLAATEHGESLALLSLFGRRAAALAVTPTALGTLFGAVTDALEGSAEAIPRAVERTLASVLFEGYVRGRDDRLRTTTDAELLAAIPVVRITPGCVALLLAGPLPTAAIAQAVDDFGRELFNAEARAAIVDVSRLSDPTAERAAEVFGADGSARMLGAPCFFAGASQAWRDAARDGRVVLEVIRFEPTFDRALTKALEVCELEVRPTSLLTRLRARFPQPK